MSSSFEKDFCGGEFWNVTKTWNTESPDFTPCFQKTVLSWSPSVIFAFFAIFEARSYRKSENRNIPWTFLILTKTLITCLLVILCLTELGFIIKIDADDLDTSKIYPVDYVTNVVFCLTYIGKVIP